MISPTSNQIVEDMVYFDVIGIAWLGVIIGMLTTFRPMLFYKLFSINTPTQWVFGAKMTIDVAAT